MDCFGSVTVRSSDALGTASWITWLLVARAERYRIFHHMESQVYPGDDVKKGTE
jgi:hypothetical protein